jgi:hypothetical protein
VLLSQQIGTKGVYWNLWSSQSTAIDATIPVIGAGTATFTAYTDTPSDGSTAFVYPRLNASTDLTLAMPAPSVLTAPIAAAAGVKSSTMFTWSAAPMNIYQVDLATTPIMGSAMAKYQIQTTALLAVIPTVPELPLPRSQSFDWFVQSFGPHTSIDDAVSGVGLATSLTVTFEDTFHTLTASPSRTFYDGALIRSRCHSMKEARAASRRTHGVSCLLIE